MENHPLNTIPVSENSENFVENRKIGENLPRASVFPRNARRLFRFCWNFVHVFVMIKYQLLSSFSPEYAIWGFPWNFEFLAFFLKILHEFFKNHIKYRSHLKFPAQHEQREFSIFRLSTIFLIFSDNRIVFSRWFSIGNDVLDIIFRAHEILIAKSVARCRKFKISPCISYGTAR